MQGLNKVLLIGHLGKDPDYLTFENGKTMAKCSLATSESYRNEAGELQTHTEWHHLILWMGLADYAHKYLKKGSLVYVEGKIKTRSFEDKDRVKRYVSEIIVERINQLKGAAGGDLNPEENGADGDTGNIDTDTHIPF